MRPALYKNNKTFTLITREMFRQDTRITDMSQCSVVMTQYDSVNISINDSSKNTTFSHDSSMIYKVSSYEAFNDA